ncbi:esterase/lipase family protein [Rhizobium ruizarguesonis]
MPTESSPHVVVLVHGIRDYALWQNEIRDTLERQGFIVEPTNYDRFNLLKFLVPLPYFRKQAIADVENQIDIVVQNNAGAKISVIAHSFGTYVVAHLLQKRFNIKFHRIIFCGSVLSFRFPFEQIQNRFDQPILNEVGTNDIWPAVAQSVTFGYGNSGSYGFRRPLVRDRWHTGAGHGYFLDAKFCTQFWVPFLRSGCIEKTTTAPVPQGKLVQALSIFQVRFLYPVVLLATGWLLWNTDHPPVAKTTVLGDAQAGLFCAIDQVKNPFPTFFDYVTVNVADCSPSNESASRSFLVSYPPSESAPARQMIMPGYANCFESDFYEKAPVVDNAIQSALTSLSNRISCTVTSSVTRVIKLGYINEENDSKTVAFAQMYDLGDDQRLTINQVPFTDVVNSEDLPQVKFGTNRKFSTSDILEQIRLFRIPGQPVEFGKFNSASVETGWVFIGYVDKELGHFKEGPYIKVVSTNKRVPGRFVELGDQIDLTVKRELIIKDYHNGSSQPLASPTTIPGGVLRPDDKTGIILPMATRWLVSDVVLAGFDTSEVLASWVRLREVPQ